jgi:hypothetical protein
MEVRMRSLLILAVAVFVACSALSFARADDEKKGPVTGILVDQACAGKMMAKDDPEAAAEKHPRSCAMKDACASSGYAVISGKTLYKFDDKGTQLAKDYLAKADNSMHVTVNGSIEDGKMEVTSITPAEKK